MAILSRTWAFEAQQAAMSRLRRRLADYLEPRRTTMQLTEAQREKIANVLNWTKCNYDNGRYARPGAPAYVELEDAIKIVSDLIPAPAAYPIEKVQGAYEHVTHVLARLDAGTEQHPNSLNHMRLREAQTWLVDAALTAPDFAAMRIEQARDRVANVVKALDSPPRCAVWPTSSCHRDLKDAMGMLNSALADMQAPQPTPLFPLPQNVVDEMRNAITNQTAIGSLLALYRHLLRVNGS